MIFFFKQKTAYEMLRSLVGSEMCIRDSFNIQFIKAYSGTNDINYWIHGSHFMKMDLIGADTCLLYTSDAADDLLCVDLGGRRIIKKKNNKKKNKHNIC